MNLRFFATFCFAGLIVNAAWASDMSVTSPKAMIYAEPSEESPTKGYIRQGKSLKTYSQDGEFYEVKLKSGQQGWIKMSDVQAREAEVEEGDSAPRSSGDDDFKRWNIQIGVSAGQSGGRNYTEVNLGVGYYFYRWLEWHNAAFASLDRVTNIYGLDSSVRGVLNTDLGGVAHIHAFAGPGYRVATESYFNTLFAEAGLIASVAGFSLGGGVRTFYYSMRDANRQTENQYFIILSGSTRL